MGTPREQDCLNWLVKGGLFGNMTCDLRPEGKEGAWFVKIWGGGGRISGSGDSTSGVPKAGLSLANMTTWDEGDSGGECG